MKQRREMMNLIGGLIVGFIVGALVIGAADVDLFGTAADEEVTRNYYMVPLADYQAWIEEGDDAETSLASMEGLTAAQDIASLNDASTAFLSDAYDRLGGDEPDEKFAVCLALNNDPYSTSGPLLYVYLQVPENMVDDMPEQFTAEEADPKEFQDSLVWSIDCYVGED